MEGLVWTETGSGKVVISHVNMYPVKETNPPVWSGLGS